MSHIGFQGVMLPHALLRHFPRGLMPAVVPPGQAALLDNPRIQQTSVAILPVPLLLHTAWRR
jgi:hypothetical protein